MSCGGGGGGDWEGIPDCGGKIAQLRLQIREWAAELGRVDEVHRAVGDAHGDGIQPLQISLPEWLERDREVALRQRGRERDKALRSELAAQEFEASRLKHSSAQQMKGLAAQTVCTTTTSVRNAATRRASRFSQVPVVVT